MKNLILLLSLSLSFSAFADDQAVDGQAIYSKYCIACHSTGVANAPKVHDTQAWGERFTKAEELIKKENPDISDQELKEKVYANLIATVKKGLGAMPPGGMCPKCTDEEYTAAINFMKSEKSE